MKGTEKFKQGGGKCRQPNTSCSTGNKEMFEEHRGEKTCTSTCDERERDALGV